MLRYFIQVIQNLSGTAGLAALLFLAAYRESSQNRRIWLFWVSLAGITAALILAILRRTTALVNRGFVNTYTLSAAIIVGIVFLFLYLGEKRFSRLRAVLYDPVTALLIGLLLFYGLPTIFLYPTEFLLAGESFLSTDFLFKLIGFTAGLLVVLLGAFALFETGKALPASLTRIVLAVYLMVNMVNQAAVIFQFLLARRLIPMIRWLFRIIAALINYNRFFLYFFLALTFILPLLLFIQSVGRRGTGSPADFKNPGEHRKFKALTRSRRRWSLIVAAGYAISLVSLTVLKASLERGVVLSPAEPMTIAGTEIRIPIEQIADGHLHRFAFGASNGTEVRFIVIKKNEAAYGVGLDACDICGATGYYERKNQVICRLCDVVMNISTIGFEGGCNPVPLAYSLRGGNMLIKTEHLENEKGRFE
jgi:uncharacterized membrane protein